MTDEMISSLRLFLEIGTACAVLITVYVVLAVRSSISEIRLEQAQVKESLVQRQTNDKESFIREMALLKTDFVHKNAEINQTFAVHVAQDDLNFKTIKEGLLRIENKIEAKIASGYIYMRPAIHRASPRRASAK